MPKPKSGELYVRELRITPPDGLPITDWLVNTDDFVKLIAAEEGGEETGKKLHYHLYVETTRSESWLKKWVYKIGHCYGGESGNAVFFSRKVHENTIGYVVKSANIVCRHGVDNMFIDEWIKKSDQYVKDKATARKKIQRSKQGVVSEMVEKVNNNLHDGKVVSSVAEISAALVNYYSSYDCYPNRNQHELLVLKLIHPYNSSYPEMYYMKHL